MTLDATLLCYACAHVHASPSVPCKLHHLCHACFTICAMQASPSVPCKLHHLCHASFSICAMQAPPSVPCKLHHLCHACFTISIHSTHLYERLMPISSNVWAELFSWDSFIFLHYGNATAVLHVLYHFRSYFCTPLLIIFLHTFTDANLPCYYICYAYLCPSTSS